MIVSGSDEILPTEIAMPGAAVENILSTGLDQKRLAQDEILPLKEVMHTFEEKYITRAVELCGGNIALAAEKLGVHKSGVYRKLDEYKTEGTP